jgi:hypothetical protein
MSSGYRSVNRNNKYGGRRDAKEISRQRKEIVALDPDICGRDDLEDDDVEQTRPQQKVRHSETVRISNNLAIRQANQLLNSGAGNRSRNLLCTIVTVRHSATSGLKHVLQSIANYLDNFRPIAPQIREQDIEFYITDDKEAEAIKALSRRIVDKRNRNSRFIIQTRKASAPWTSLDKRIRDVMMNVLAKRYNKTFNSLDLSDFGADKDFTSNKIIVSLTRNDVLVALFDMIEKEYSNITQLSLKDNRLRSFIFLSSLVFRCKNVKTLDLSSNDFRNIEDLDRISMWNIEKLLLENNPFCTSYIDADTYTRCSDAITMKIEQCSFFQNRILFFERPITS